MKGLKRQDSSYLLELYKRMAPSSQLKDIGQLTNPFEDSTDSSSSTSTLSNILKSPMNDSIASTIKQTASNVTSRKRIENLIKKRLP